MTLISVANDQNGVLHSRPKIGARRVAPFRRWTRDSV